jgi:hypothetical protein
MLNKVTLALKAFKSRGLDDIKSAIELLQRGSRWTSST